MTAFRSIVRLTSLSFLSLFLFLVIPTSQAFAATFYVSPTGNDSAAGTQAQPWRTLSKAGATAVAGDTVLVTEGTYSAVNGQNYVLRPANSGTASQPITFKSATSVRPILMGVCPTIVDLSDRNYIVFDNFELRDPCDQWGRWMTLDNSNYNTINNTRFVVTTTSRNVDWTGVNFTNSTYNKLLNCHVDNWGIFGDPYNNGGDAIQLNGASHHNLIEGCFIGAGGHAGLQLDGGDTYFNVIRNNTFQNRLEKAFETTQRRSGRFEYNLFERNTCIDSRYNSEFHGGMCLHINANRNIIRYNTLRGALGWAIDVQTWGSETLSNVSNHIFHNTIVNNGIDQTGYHAQSTTGIEVTNFGYTGAPHRDHVIKNNILYDNKPQTNFNPPRTIQLRLDYSGLSGAPFSGIRVAGNLMYFGSTTEHVIDVAGLPTGTAAYYNQTYPNNFWGNIQQAPLFLTYNQGTASNPLDGSFDLRLQANSPGVDQGVDLTQTTAAGSGTVITVQDAMYFHDGFNGIIAPDMIMVGNEKVTVRSIDYATNRITVDRSITWAANTPVNLPFAGNKPDIGAFESGSTAPTSPIPSPSPVISPRASGIPSPSPDLSACKAADINSDGTVNKADRLVLVTDFFKRLPINPRSDINKDGIVDLLDYSFLAKSYQLSCPN